MKVALYARVSSDRQDTDLSISGQLRALRDYAGQHGHEVVREFVDEAESGRSADRPAFRAMAAEAKFQHPSFQGILVWKLNRFARSRVDSITYKTLFRSKGIEIISTNEPVDESPTGQLIEGVIESIDEFYSANLAQDIQRGMRENASRGFFNGSRPPFGLQKVDFRDGAKTRHKLAPEPPGSMAAQVVQRIFGMAAKGLGCKAIAKLLNAEGVRSSTGAKWGNVTVHKVLTNEAYKGTLVWGGRHGHLKVRGGLEPIRVPNAWAAIVSLETFDQVQSMLGSKRPQVVHPRTLNSPLPAHRVLFL